MQSFNKLTDVRTYQQPPTVSAAAFEPVVIDGINLKLDRAAETMWASLRAIGDLFGARERAVYLILDDLRKQGRLPTKSIRSIEEMITTVNGRAYTQTTDHYGLDAILTVGDLLYPERADNVRAWLDGTLRLPSKLSRRTILARRAVYN